MPALTLRRAAGLAALLALLLCLPSLRGGFVIDDAYLVVDNPSIRGLGQIPRHFVRAWGGGGGGAGHAGVNAAYYRPLTSSLHTVEYALFGLHPLGWHAVSVLLHAAATALATLLAVRLLGSLGAGLLAGLLFAVHPVHTEAIAAICYQTTLLAAGLALAALWALGRARDDARKRWVLLAFAFSGLAGLAKEEAVVLPLLGAAWLAIAPPVERARVWATGAGALLAGAALVLGARGAVVTGSSIRYFGDAGSAVIVPTMARVVTLYAELLVAPLRLCPFYDWFIVPPSAHLSAAAVLGFVIVLGVVAGVLALRRRAPAVAVGLAWLALALVPVMQVVPILNVAAERFLYLPSLGFAVVVAAAALALQRRAPRAALLGAGIVLALLAARTAGRWSDWRDDRTLNLATARDFAETPTPLLNLAQIEHAAGDDGAALRRLEEAQRRVPSWPVPEHMAARIRGDRR